MSLVAPRPATPIAALRGGARAAVAHAEAPGLARRLTALLGMLVLLGGFVGMHQMSGSPLAHGPAHTVVAGHTVAAAHGASGPTGDVSTPEEAPSGTGHGEMEAMCLLILVALLTLTAPGLRRRLPDAVTRLARVVAPWWRLGSALRPTSLVALGISRR